MSPEPSKTLPSLELLAIYMGLKCVSNIVHNKKFQFNISNITFKVLVALNWVLYEKVNKKNIFVQNRIKEITEMKKISLNLN